MVHDTRGNPLYFVSQIEDITERKKAEEKIKEYTETLEEKIKERTGELQNANLELQALNEDSLPQRRRGIVRKIFTFNPQTLYKRRFKESPQQRLWGIKNLIKNLN